MRSITAEEAAARREEVYAARERYEVLLAAYERDTQFKNGVYAGVALGDMLEPSNRECHESEEEFRRGYLHGAREALSHMWTVVRERRIAFDTAYDGLWDWHDHQLVSWYRDAKGRDGESAMTPPPTPIVPAKAKR